jgi:acetyltransferase-like isoleucine patch superfamily enzyme
MVQIEFVKMTGFYVSSVKPLVYTLFKKGLMIKIIRLFARMTISKKIFFLRGGVSRIKTITFYQVLFKKMGLSSIIIRPLFITPEFISIGNKVKIWHDSRIEGVDKYAGKLFSPQIVLGDGVEIQQRVHITAVSFLVIGNNTSILPDVLITDIDHPYNDIYTAKGEQRIVYKKTSIGENCSIGAGAKILAGSIIGDNCIIGANSVVKGSFPAGCVIAGLPAKIIRQYDYSLKKWL